MELQTQSGECGSPALSFTDGETKAQREEETSGSYLLVKGWSLPTGPHLWHQPKKEEPRERSQPPARSWASSGASPSSVASCCVFLAPEDCDSGEGAGGEQGRSERPRAEG